MALSALIEWDVNSSGNSANGGGFKSGASGTDRSQGTSPHVTFDGATITATTAGVGATITITGYTVISGDVGNVLNITGGVNFTTGRYEITSVNTGAGTWTLDRNCTTGAGTAMTGRMGGCLDTPATAAAVPVAGNTIWIKDNAAALVVTVTFAVQGTNAAKIKISGYTTTHGDADNAVITSSTNNCDLFTLNNGDFYVIRWIDFTHSAGTTRGNGIVSVTNASANVEIADCVFDGCLSAVVSGTSGAQLTYNLSDCEIKNCTSTDGALILSSNMTVYLTECDIHDNAGAGIYSSVAAGWFLNLDHCIFDTNSYHINIANQIGTLLATHCTFYNATNDSIQFANGSTVLILRLTNNVFYGAVYHIDNAETANQIYLDSNAFGNNSSGSHTGVNANSAIIINEITLSGDPFTSAAARDFSLIPTGGGAQCRNAGVGGFDLGALQHVDSGGGGGGILIPQGMSGGFHG